MCSEQRKNIDLGFTSEHYQAGVHMCIIYRNEEERRQIISKYIDSGIKGGEAVGSFTDSLKPKEFKQWLKEGGINIPDKVYEKGQLIIKEALPTYCPNNKFNPQNMIQTLRNFYDKAIEEGYTGARVTGEMSWSLKGVPGSELLPEYEALINKLTEEVPITAMCQYDANLFDGGTLFDILEVHPFMIIHGQIMKNPAYLNPDEFLKEFYSR